MENEDSFLPNFGREKKGVPLILNRCLLYGIEKNIGISMAEVKEYDQVELHDIFFRCLSFIALIKFKSENMGWLWFIADINKMYPLYYTAQT